MIIFTPVVDVLILAGDSFFRVAIYVILMIVSEFGLSSFYLELLCIFAYSSRHRLQEYLELVPASEMGYLLQFCVACFVRDPLLKGPKPFCKSNGAKCISLQTRTQYLRPWILLNIAIISRIVGLYAKPYPPRARLIQ
jgi:hypothetical protein